MLSAAKHLCAQPDRPFAALRVTLPDRLWSLNFIIAPDRHQPTAKLITIRRGEGGAERMGGPLWSPVVPCLYLPQGLTTLRAGHTVPQTASTRVSFKNSALERFYHFSSTSVACISLASPIVSSTRSTSNASSPPKSSTSACQSRSPAQMRRVAPAIFQPASSSS